MPGCAAVFAAMEKLATIPNHTYSTETVSFRRAPLVGETITSATTTYVWVNGKWRRPPFDARRNLNDMRDADRDSDVSCKPMRDEAIDGEAAALYATHPATEVRPISRCGFPQRAASRRARLSTSAKATRAAKCVSTI